MNYSYNGFTNPYARNYQVQNFNQQQFNPQPQQPMMPQQPVQFDMPIQYVGNGTLKEAEGYILFPNQKAIFVDKSNGMIYEKICGNDGQSFMTAYKKVINESEKSIQSSNVVETTLDMGEFAKKTDLDGFVTVDQYKELKEMFNGLKGQINGLKQAPKNKSESKVDKNE